MQDTQIIKIVFGIFLTIFSIVLFIIAFKVYYKYLIQEKRCKARTKGIVKKYTLANRGGEHSGVHLPIVYYEVKGKEYKVTGPEYKSYRTVTTSSPLESNSEVEYKEDEKQRLIIKQKVNSFISIYKNPMEKIYPIGSEIDVYYDESNPRLAYVLRYCNRKWAFGLIFLSALFILILDIVIQLFI